MHVRESCPSLSFWTPSIDLKKQRYTVQTIDRLIYKQLDHGAQVQRNFIPWATKHRSCFSNLDPLTFLQRQIWIMVDNGDRHCVRAQHIWFTSIPHVSACTCTMHRYYRHPHHPNNVDKKLDCRRSLNKKVRSCDTDPLSRSNPQQNEWVYEIGFTLYIWYKSEWRSCMMRRMGNRVWCILITMVDHHPRLLLGVAMWLGTNNSPQTGGQHPPRFSFA